MTLDTNNRSEEGRTGTGNMLEAVLQAQFVLPEGVTAGFEYSMPEGFKSELAELAEVRAAALAELNAVPTHLSDKIPADLKAALMKCTSKQELTALSSALAQEVESVARSEETRLTAIHNDEKSPEQRKAELWHEIDKANEEISEDMESLYKKGKISAEMYENWKRERERLDKLPQDSPERLEGEKALAEHEKEIAGHVRNQAVIAGEPPEPEVTRIDTNADTKIKNVDTHQSLDQNTRDANAPFVMKARAIESSETVSPPVVSTVPAATTASPLFGANFGSSSELPPASSVFGGQFAAADVPNHDAPMTTPVAAGAAGRATAALGA